MDEEKSIDEPIKDEPRWMKKKDMPVDEEKKEEPEKKKEQGTVAELVEKPKEEFATKKVIRWRGYLFVGIVALIFVGLWAFSEDGPWQVSFPTSEEIDQECCEQFCNAYKLSCVEQQTGTMFFCGLNETVAKERGSYATELYPIKVFDPDIFCKVVKEESAKRASLLNQTNQTGQMEQINTTADIAG